MIGSKKEKVKEVIVDTGHHFNFDMNKIFFNQLKIPSPKYFLNINTKTVNVPDGTIQTICHKNHTMDIRNSNSISVDSVANISYERIEDVNPAGLGDLDYIITTWRRQ
jgi:hypothetical protein